jgi:hypothetical protein
LHPCDRIIGYEDGESIVLTPGSEGAVDETYELSWVKWWRDDHHFLFTPISTAAIIKPMIVDAVPGTYIAGSGEVR